ncbi:phage integrase Arm DNA-binding domain-containing protein [Cupriavidus sp. CV2]|uniref:phage integrase Arm DNA-binding domain-containing protein n=1 Tax=Cupriavidus ulmosensis TaxID=3065913 RepID=UPI00296B0210|nr:phage integrase Arm DNA-binding domain-containing protein [Cupriavidus sp. CV2]MDW3684858.1 phage integrase Arm DNA-binding domain-containing protein [Cupriavidus sp. CV2]
MAARPRIRKRANWPANLHEPREGYYTYRDPRSGKVHVLGRVPLEQAIFEAHEANASITASGPKKLAERIAEGVETVSDLLNKMPTDGLKPSTLKGLRSLDKRIRTKIGTIKCADLTTKEVADVLEKEVDAGKARWALALRSRMVAVFTKGMALGWMEKNPATVTESPKVKVRRQRLTFEQFQTILTHADEVNEWIGSAMLLALLSGQDRSTIAKWKRSDIHGDTAIVERGKTGVRIAIPLSIRLDVADMSLAEVVARCKSTGVVARNLVHHVKLTGSAKRGDSVHPDTISAAFTEARKLARIPDASAPTFHEIRSLAKRLYDEQGNVDTKSLLGHLTEKMSSLYANPRGVAPIKVRVGSK